jgi:hypothetical protein
MKAPAILSLSLLAVAGCVTQGAVQPQALNDSSSANAAPAAVMMPDASPRSEPEILFPRVFMPVTGGTPVIGIPLGGNIFQPVTGGPPVLGIPLTPDP